MIIPKLHILAESENWIVVVDRSVTIYELFNSYMGRGKVTAVIFPLYLTDEKVKGVVLVAFGANHDEHRSLSIPNCLHSDDRNDRQPNNVSRITSRYRDYRDQPLAAGCHFRLENVTYESGGGYLGNIRQVTFWDSSGSFGCDLVGFDVRRLLRAWFQHVFKWTKSVTEEGPLERSEFCIMDDIKASLKVDTEYCLEFMSLDPLFVFNKNKSIRASDEFNSKIRESFGLI